MTLQIDPGTTQGFGSREPQRGSRDSNPDKSPGTFESGDSAFLYPPLEPAAEVVTEVLVDGCSLDDVKRSISLIREWTAGPLDLVLVAVPAGEGVAVELAVRRALRVEPDRSTAPAENQTPEEAK